MLRFEDRYVGWPQQDSLCFLPSSECCEFVTARNSPRGCPLAPLRGEMGHSSAGHSKPARREDELTVLKLRKLRQQKDLADDFNSILTRQVHERECNKYLRGEGLVWINGPIDP